MNTYLYLGEYDRFLKSLPANDSPLLLFYYGFGSYYKHNDVEAEADFERAFEMAPEPLPAQVGKGLSDGMRHQKAQGIGRLHETERKMSLRGVRDPEAMYKVAQAYTIRGDSRAALRMLKSSNSGGFFCYSYIANDPLLSSLHGLPEFSSLLEQTKERQQQFEQRFFGINRKRRPGHFAGAPNLPTRFVTESQASRCSTCSYCHLLPPAGR